MTRRPTAKAASRRTASPPRSSRRSARSRAASPRTSSSPSTRSCGASTAATSTRAPILGRFPTSGPRVLQGPGENAGVGRRRRRLGRGLQDREPQPPERRRALPGRRHRRRRHPARHLHDGRAARSPTSTRCASASSTSRARATCSTASSAASPATATASASPPSAARSTSSRLRRQHPGQRLHAGLVRADASCAPRPAGVGNPSSQSAPRPAATASTAPACSPRARSSTRRSRRSARPSRSATPSPRSCSSRPASSCSRTTPSSHAGHGRRRPHLSSSKMASKGGVASTSTLDRVPLREADMTPYEIMLSESQERMLAIVEPAPKRTCARSSTAGTSTARHRRGHRHEACCASSGTARWSRIPARRRWRRVAGDPHALGEARLLATSRSPSTTRATRARTTTWARR
jgi:hypothetical protein